MCVRISREIDQMYIGEAMNGLVTIQFRNTTEQ